ncbi:MAG: class I SAM-dependent methyltransferase [Candidatus Altiarchaeota archaeon]
MKGRWYEKFRDDGKLYFNDDSYPLIESMMDEDMVVYSKHVPEGGSILECCCGPGYTAIPLSKHYDVTAFDRDDMVLDAARQNALKYGGDVRFDKEEFSNILVRYGPDSFDAASSGGVLEHFTKPEIRELVKLQLTVAPIVFAQMPLHDEGGGRPIEMGHGIGLYAYGREDWLNDILAGFNLLDSRRLPEKPEIARFREFMVVIGRDGE